MLKFRIGLGLALVLATLVPVAAFTATLEVPGQYPTIAAGIAAANPGDTIKISPGIYHEWGLELTAGITLVGSGESPEECVIDAQGQGRILAIQFVPGATVVRNLTLAGGLATGETSYDSSGGAIFANSTTLSLENCRFVHNSALYSGGAVRVLGSTFNMNGCQFEDNAAAAGGGALDLSYTVSGQVAATSFAGNRANYGGALACRGGSDPIFSDCFFSENLAEGSLAAGGGGMAFFYSYPRFERCVFRGNRAARGGALFNDENARTDLSHCTLLQNTATGGGGGLLVNNASPVIESTLVVFQAGEGILSLGDLVPQINCTDIYGNSRGDWVGNIAAQQYTRGNLTVDPLFCSLDAASPPVLQEGSPCTLEGGACDDLGALGSGCFSSMDDDPVTGSAPPGVALQNLGAWPNPFNPRTTVHFELGLSQRIRVDIYGIDGRRVRRLADEILPAGSHDLTWNGTDDRGRALASGPYLVVVAGEASTRRLKITLLK